MAEHYFLEVCDLEKLRKAGDDMGTGSISSYMSDSPVDLLDCNYQVP